MKTNKEATKLKWKVIWLKIAQVLLNAVFLGIPKLMTYLAEQCNNWKDDPEVKKYHWALWILDGITCGIAYLSQLIQKAINKAMDKVNGELENAK